MKTLFVFTIVLVVIATACGDRGNPRLLNGAEMPAIDNRRAGTHEVISKQDLKELHDQSDVRAQVGRFLQSINGFGTWRFDTPTGRSCLMLATDETWKKANLAAQGCQWQCRRCRSSRRPDA